MQQQHGDSQASIRLPYSCQVHMISYELEELKDIWESLKAKQRCFTFQGIDLVHTIEEYQNSSLQQIIAMHN
ncbi:unnamed protein product [Citrullus colocynthis]|uniref:Uncharacterized protein n=1 Tax=Citrullus colocynthis TaxID=252529 RepID=A0ABP0XLY6_9ROSI